MFFKKSKMVKGSRQCQREHLTLYLRLLELESWVDPAKES
jgi:hypothetical protein